MLEETELLLKLFGDIDTFRVYIVNTVIRKDPVSVIRLE